MGTGLPRPGECRDCHEPIRFVSLDSGRMMPVNPLPSTEGKGSIAARQSGYRLEGFVICRDRLSDPRYPLRFTAHYATCIEQRPQRPAAPEPDVPLF